jgi:hypothetical protein
MNAVVGWDNAVRYELAERSLNVIFNGPDGEMIRIARDGFYVRGERVDQSADEAKRVYRAFIAWMRGQGMAV